MAGRSDAIRRAARSATAGATSGRITPSRRGWWRLSKRPRSAASVKRQRGAETLRRQARVDRHADDAVARAAPEQLGQLTRLEQIGAVDDDDVHRQLHGITLALTITWPLGGDLGPGVEQLLDALGQLGAVGLGDRDPAGIGALVDVRQPAGEPPLVAGVVGGQDPQPHLGGRVRGHQVHHHATGDRPRPVRRADDAERAGAQQVALDRRAPLVLGECVVGIVGGDRRRDRRQADGHAHEVVVRRRPLPHPAMPCRRDQQRQPTAMCRRPAPVALLAPEGDDVVAERGEVGGVRRRGRSRPRARGAACAGTPRPPSRSGRWP